MGFMNVNGSTGQNNNFWNYANKQKEEYSTELVGYVVELQLAPKTVFGSNTIDRFEDGNPKRNVRVVVLKDNGIEEIWDFNPGGRDKSAQGGKDKRSKAMKALVDGILKAIPNAEDIDECLGMRIKITTEEPPEGWSWSNTNPRPWHVQINPKMTVEHRGTTVKPDWEREGGEVDAPPIEPTQVGDGLAAAQAAAQQAVAKMNAGVTWAQDEQPPASVYDEDIPF